jgi:Fanconi anemia group M protein
MTFITHPYIRRDAVESRQYQLAIAMHALEGHTLVVIPTGLGKTAIALIVAASRLLNTGGKVLVLAPTKPLVEQHLRYFERLLVFPGKDQEGGLFAFFTGDNNRKERAGLWETARVICATPQVIKNDLISGEYSLEDVSLLVVDECHRAVGNYAYTFIAGRYRDTAKNPLILGMTASPGGTSEKIGDICTTLGVGIVETRTEHDPDVTPYIHERDLEVIPLQLPPELQRAVASLSDLLDSRIEGLKRLGFEVPPRQTLSMKALSGLNGQVQERIRSRDPNGYTGASIYAEIMKLKHAVSLAESQGTSVLSLYLARLETEATSGTGSKASQRLARDPGFISLLALSRTWEQELHPKYAVLPEIIGSQLENQPESRIIIFATYRDTVSVIVDTLARHGIHAERFVGQATRDADKGLSQKKQIATLTRFREGEFRVLVATSVGEEGLDVPSTDLVVFFEPVPSEIRSIQRKGRTGRSGAGRIIVLSTRGTSDEAFRFVSNARERSMHSGIAGISRRISTDPASEEQNAMLQTRQARIDAFDGVTVVVDDRELPSGVPEALSLLGVRVTVQRLESGDYAIGDRILVERKTSRDFVESLIERDLIGQLRELSRSAPRPVLIIEGGPLFDERNIHPNAIRGALVSAAVDLGMGILFSSDARDTAEYLMVLARREESGHSERSHHAHKGHRNHSEQQEYIISSLPDIGIKQARELLGHFGTVREVIDADEESLREVPGIGEKKAKNLVELTRKPYSRSS